MPYRYTDPFARLRDRSPIGWIRERDVDLLLCSELFHNPELSALIAKTAGLENAGFAFAWVSVPGPDGETDLVVEFAVPGGSAVVLIENKIGAGFQPDQAMRYGRRADGLRRDPTVGMAATLLLAPESYLSRPGGEEFDASLSYERVMETLQGGDGRSRFFAAALEAGIENSRRGYVAVPDEDVTSVWEAIAEEASRVAPALRFSFSGERPGASTWVYFKDAEGMEVCRGLARLVLKGDRGQADLQVSRCAPHSLRRAAAELLETGMTIVPAGGSSSIRLTVPRIDFSAPPEGQRDAIRQGLTAIDRLRQLAADGDLARRLSGGGA